MLRQKDHSSYDQFTVRLVDQSCSPPLLPSIPPRRPIPPQSLHPPSLTRCGIRPTPRSKVLHVPPYLLFTYEYSRALYFLRSSSSLSLCSAPLRPLASSSSLVLPYPPDRFRGVSPRYLLASLHFFFSSPRPLASYCQPTNTTSFFTPSPSQHPPKSPSLRRRKK